MSTRLRPFVVGAVVASAVIMAISAGIAGDTGTTTTSRPAKAETVKLTSVKLPAGYPIFSPGDSHMPQVSAGVLRPNRAFVFTPAKSTADLTLGDVTGTFAWATGKREFGLKVGSSAIAIKVKPDGTCDPITFDLGKNRPYTLAFPMAMAMPSTAALYYRSGSIQKGTVAGEPIAFYDDNVDGAYVIGQDAVRFGNGTGVIGLFSPSSRYVASRTAIVELQQLAVEGNELTAMKYAGPTGKFSVTSNIPVEVQVAVASADAELSLATLAGPVSEMNVIPSDYKLAYGVAYAPTLKKVIATIAPGELPAVTVKEGQKAALDIGGPFTLTFNPTVTGRKVSISSGTFKIKGKGGEMYANISHATEPQVAWVIDGKEILAGKMEFG